MVLANPPYSIKKWNRSAWESDAWGRNFLGTPPQGRADYAFFQHILKSMDPKTGRCAILFPHGVLFRNEEAEMRRKLIEADLVECVLGLGPGLFYNSPMEACVVVCRSRKPDRAAGTHPLHRRGGEIARERAQSFLRDRSISSASSTPTRRSRMKPVSLPVASNADVLAAGGNLAIARYVKKPKPTVAAEDAVTLAAAWGAFDAEGREFWTGMDALVDMLDGLAPRRTPMLEKAIPNKAGWTRVAFGDVVRLSNRASRRIRKLRATSGSWGWSISTPATCGYGGGQILSDGTTFTSVFKTGQVLFGKRRAYQRKVAVADFAASARATSMCSSLGRCALAGIAAVYLPDRCVLRSCRRHIGRLAVSADQLAKSCKL